MESAKFGDFFYRRKYSATSRRGTGRPCSQKNLLSSIKKTVEEYQPDVIGLSAMTFQFNTAWRIAEFIKSLHRDIKIAIGGYHATLMYEEIASSDNGKPFDYIVRGEGEKTFGDMLDAIEGKQKWEDISGLSYRRNGGFLHNPPRPLENLETLQLPRRNARMWDGYLFSGKKLDMVETSRGCTMTCNFCSMNRMYGRTFRAYNFERVMLDLANAKNFGAQYIAFADDNITLNAKRFESLSKNRYERYFDQRRTRYKYQRLQQVQWLLGKCQDKVSFA